MLEEYIYRVIVDAFQAATVRVDQKKQQKEFEMRPKCRVWQRVAWLGMSIVLASFLLTIGACSGVGEVIAPEKRIPFKSSGVNSGQWQSMDASLMYRCTTDGQPAGKVRISGSVTARSRVAQLRLSIRFLDAGGKVLAGEQIYSSGYREQSVGGEFNRIVDIPAGTEALAFASHSQPHRGHR
jgi:hypothetical protein